jgi:MFS family permease
MSEDVAKVHPEVVVQKYNPLSTLQVKLRTNKRFKMIVANVTMLAVFVDILGSALVMPVFPALCSYAEGGPVDTIMKMDIPLEARVALRDEIIHPDAFKDPKPPFKFSFAMNVVMSFGQLGSAIGSFMFGMMCDKIGAKIPMQICLFNGIIGYLIIYASGKWYNSYYLFAFGLFWNNLFGNTMGVATIYLRNLFEEGPERDAYVGGVLGMGMIGGAVGSLIAMPFVISPKNGANFFNAVWLALGLTVIVFLLVCFVLVPASRPTEQEETKAKEKGNEKTPSMAKRILILTVIASALDSAGDEGTRMARGTIISAIFPEWSTTERQNYLLLAMIGIIIVALILLGVMRKCMNLASIATVGCLFTLATQLVLMVEWEAGPYIALWHVGKLFGFLSTLASGFIIMEVAPKNLLGMWNGYNEALTNLSAGIAPLIFAPIYDSIGNPRGQEMLAATAAVSFFATVAYVPLVGMLPKPPKKEDKNNALKDLEVYDQMTNLSTATCRWRLSIKLR